MVSDPPFSATLWASIEPLYAQILAHPFLTGLTNGSLDPAAFQFYAVQDSLYLDRFARALGIAAAKAPTADDTALLLRHAGEANAVETALHETFFAEFGLTPAAVRATPLAPTNLAYTSYFTAAAYGGSFAEALAALLPCYWIYWEVGKTLLERGSPHPLYHRWIATYGGEEYAQTVRDVLALMDRVAAGLGPAEQARCAEHFAVGSRYELLFWEMGYRREAWPLA